MGHRTLFVGSTFLPAILLNAPVREQKSVHEFRGSASVTLAQLQGPLLLPLATIATLCYLCASHLHECN